jgi:hypothetical protein
MLAQIAVLSSFIMADDFLIRAIKKSETPLSWEQKYESNLYRI